MNWEIIANSKLVESLGWTILHSVWQIALIASVLWLCLRILQKSAANARYAVAVFALAFSFILPVVTFVHLTKNQTSSFFRGENSRPGYAEQNIRDLRRAEDFPAAIKIESPISAVNPNNVFASVENLLNILSENFPAVLPFVVGMWFFGVAFFALRMIGGVWQLRVYKTRETTKPDAPWQERFAALCEKLETTRAVKFRQSNLIKTPVVIGWLKPVILVPASVFLQISTEELETIIAHELIHIRRCDALVNLAQGAVEVLFFYHPGVWWISAAIRREREFATDETVIEIFSDSRIAYAKALANLEAIRLLANQDLPSITTAANGGNLMQRITKILQKNTETNGANAAWSALLACLLISAVLLTVFSFNQAPFVNAQTRAKNRKIAVGFVSIPPVDRTR